MSATTFAPARAGQGRTLTWEALQAIITPKSISTVFGTNVLILGNFTTRFLTLIPQNVTRGVVTLERIRGEIRVFFDRDNSVLTAEEMLVQMQIQLVPIRNGAIVNEAVLSPENLADLESNRILWRRNYYVADVIATTVAGSVLNPGQMNTRVDVDVKVRRRFDRALWALIIVVRSATAAEDFNLCTLDLRGLFRATDAL